MIRTCVNVVACPHYNVDQSMEEKKGCERISSAPSIPEPNLSSAFTFSNYK